MAAAAATTTLRVGALVWDNDYKHPVVLAKELATIDVLSGGRLEIGLGAGWLAEDYEQSGIPFDSNKVRVDRFEEGLAVIKGAMSSEPFSFAGEHYTIINYTGTPRSVQAPCPPILVGGGGKRVLTIAAREADIIGINSMMAAGLVGPEALPRSNRLRPSSPNSPASSTSPRTCAYRRSSRQTSSRSIELISSRSARTRRHRPLVK